MIKWYELNHSATLFLNTMLIASINLRRYVPYVARTLTNVRAADSYNLLHNFENPLDRERVSRTVLRRYAISPVSVNVGASHSHPHKSCESPRRNLVTYLADETHFNRSIGQILTTPPIPSGKRTKEGK